VRGALGVVLIPWLVIGTLTWGAFSDDAWWSALSIIALACISLVGATAFLLVRWVESAWQPLASEATMNAKVAASYAAEMGQCATTALAIVRQHDPEAGRLLGQRILDVTAKHEELMT